MYARTVRRAALLSLPVIAACLFVGARRGVRAQAPEAAVRPGSQHVRVEIDDRHSLAVTTVAQEIVNDGDEAPVSLVLPVPTDAAILRYEVLAPPPRKGEKPEQRGTLEPAGRGLCRALVSRVPRRGRAQIELVYAQPLVRRGQRRKYVYPVLDPESGAPAALRVSVRIDAAAPPRQAGSATHPMSLRRSPRGAVTLEYDSAEPPAGRDLVVDYQLPARADDARARLAVFTPPDREEDPYFLLTLPPPAALLQGRRSLEKPADIVFCMDVSGSTRGRKLNGIREAIHDGLADLSPSDRFGVVAFDDDARPFRLNLASAASGTVSQAIRFVNRIRPGGGSDPSRALRAAVDLLERRKSAASRPGIIAVVVDDEDPADLARAAAELGVERRGIRLVALGAKEDSRLVNYRVQGRSLRPGPAIALSRAAITHGPTLTAARFDSGSLNVSYVYPVPERLPDLPLSTPVVLMGRLNQAPPLRGKVALAGTIEGAVRSLEVDYAWQPLSPGSPVPALWADRRARRLHQLAGQDRHDSEELREAAGRVAKQHRLLATPEP